MQRNEMIITTRNKIVSNNVERTGRKVNKQQIKAWNFIRAKKLGETTVKYTMIPYPHTNGRYLHEVLKDGEWKGFRCFIIGGGKSLKDFDFSKLDNELTIGINRAYEKLDCNILVCSDERLYGWIKAGKFGDESRRKFECFKGLKVWVNNDNEIQDKDIYTVTRLSDAWISESIKHGLYLGDNTGFAALNLAICLKANPIYLLGFDMKGANGKQANWHDGYPVEQGSGVYSKFIKSFETIAPLIKTDLRNLQVINLNPESELKCFDFGKIEDITDFGSKDLLIDGPYGFGDTFYLRSLVRHLAKKHRDIYVRTTLPEVFWDLKNIKCVRPDYNKMRTQQEHIEKMDKENKWSKRPKGKAFCSWQALIQPWTVNDAGYKSLSKRGNESTSEFIENEYSIGDYDFSFPVKREWLKEARKELDLLNTKGKKICIIRQPTTRKEWNCSSRNPKIEYFQMLIDKHKDDYYFISIANNKEGEEWFETELKGINKRFDKGELSLTTIFGLIKLSDMMITYPGFFSVVAAAVKSKCFCMFGGCTGPEVIFHKNMGLENFEIVSPDPFCHCMLMEHNCYKEIPESVILEKFAKLKDRGKKLKKVIVGVPPGIGDIHWIMTILESFKEKNCIDKLKIVANLAAKPDHSYTLEYLKLIPFIDSAERIDERIPFKFSIIGGDGTPLQKDKAGCDYVIEFNSPLETNTELKNILPEYDVDFNYPIVYPSESKKFAEEIKKKVGGKLYLLYTSSIEGNVRWADNWKIESWINLATKIYNSTGCQPVLVGADWDKDYAQLLIEADTKKIIYDLTAKTTLPQTLALIRESNFLVGFLSGLTMMAVRFQKPIVSFWMIKGITQKGHVNKAFMRTWTPPDVDEHGYMPYVYGEERTNPDNIFKALGKYL